MFVSRNFVAGVNYYNYFATDVSIIELIKLWGIRRLSQICTLLLRTAVMLNVLDI